MNPLNSFRLRWFPDQAPQVSVHLISPHECPHTTDLIDYPNSFRFNALCISQMKMQNRHRTDDQEITLLRLASAS